MIEAFQFDGDLIKSDGIPYVPQWATTAYLDGELSFEPTATSPSELFIKQGVFVDIVPVGNYVVKTAKDVLFTLSPMQFEVIFLESKPRRLIKKTVLAEYDGKKAYLYQVGEVN